LEQEILQRLCDAVRRKRCCKWQGQWFPSCPKWLFSIPYSKYGPQGDSFRNHGGHQIECNGWTPEDSKRSLPAVFPTMAGSMEQVCVCTWLLIWRWLGKRCHMSYHYSAVLPFWELFWLPFIYYSVKQYSIYIYIYIYIYTQ
jgi:hypothetical protein